MKLVRSSLIRRAAPLIAAALLATSGAGRSVLAARPAVLVPGAPQPAVDVASLASLPLPPDPRHNTPAAALHHDPAVSPVLLVHIPHSMTVMSKPGSGRAVGTMPAGSLQLGVPTVAWVVSVSKNGRYGRVPVPYTGTPRTGWIPLGGLKREHTGILVRADLSSHQITVERLGKVIMRIRAATGAPSTPTPTGLYFVTDRLAFPVGSSYGSFVFGISGIQPRLGNWPHNQLAIHGTNNPASIGTSASAGCLRVSERSLALLKPLLRIGTPVVVQR